MTARKNGHKCATEVVKYYRMLKLCLRNTTFINSACRTNNSEVKSRADINEALLERKHRKHRAGKHFEVRSFYRVRRLILHCNRETRSIKILLYYVRNSRNGNYSRLSQSCVPRSLYIHKRSAFCVNLSFPRSRTRRLWFMRSVNGWSPMPRVFIPSFYP